MQKPDKTPPPETIPAFTSAQLFKGAQLVEILHADQRYFLRLTRENKLILTK